MSESASDKPYNIRDRKQFLTPAKGSKTKYICPVCNGNDLDISRDGAYNCFSGGCVSKDIRAAIDRLDPNWQPFQGWKKPIRPKSETEYFYPDRDGNRLVKVERFDPGNGDKKTFKQRSWGYGKWQPTNPDNVKKLVPVYRYAEVRAAIEEGQTIFWVEGELTADLLWAIGIPATTTIGGSGAFSSYGDYIKDVEGGKFVICPDRDVNGVKYATEVASLLGDRVSGYYLAGSESLWRNTGGGMDIGNDIEDNYLSKGEIVAKVIDIDKYLSIVNPTDPPNPVGRPRKQSPTPIDRDYQRLAQGMGIDLPEGSTKADGVPLSKLVKLELDLYAVYGDRLEFNEMSCEIELDRQPISLDSSKSFVARSLHYDYTQQDCDIALAQVARRHSYSPVKQYLESVRGKATSAFIERVPERYWGNQSTLQNYLFFKKLIACVARVMSPGCADHNLLILNGGQGAHKSMALSILSGEDWFTDDLRSIDDKDELAKLSRFWILELAEVDYLFGKKETELFKRFLSGRKDTFRPPYGRSNISKARTSALFATTNKSEFLTDPTGSRRYWIVDVRQKIDTDRLRADRDMLWAAALDAYESGVKWWLEDSIEIQHEAANEQYQEPDIWMQLIQEKLPMCLKTCKSIEYTSINDIADRILKIEVEKQDKRLRNRIGAILRSMGFDTTHVTFGGQRVKVWAKSLLEENPSSQPEKKDEGRLEGSSKPAPTLNIPYIPQVPYKEETKEKINNLEERGEIINNLLPEFGNSCGTKILRDREDEVGSISDLQAVPQVSRVEDSPQQRLEAAVESLLWVLDYPEDYPTIRAVLDPDTLRAAVKKLAGHQQIRVKQIVEKYKSNPKTEE